MVGGLLPCTECRRHVRVGERGCPFCGAALEARETIAELRLLTPLDRSRLVALGAVLSAAGIALGCREPAVAIYGAPPTRDDVVAPAPSAEPPVTEPAPSASSAESTSVPAPKPTTTAQPAPTQKRGPDQMMAPAYGGPPRQALPELDSKSK